MARASFPSDDIDKLLVRFPEGMRDRIKSSAEITGRSMNAEIIQRLKRSFIEEEYRGVKVSLDAVTEEALASDADLHNLSMSERAAQIISGAYDDNPDYALVLEKMNNLVVENADLRERVSVLKQEQDMDFLIYYTKAVQLGQLARSILANKKAPPELSATAQELLDLNAAEIATLRDRHEEAIFKQRLQEHSRKLQREAAQNGADQDDEDAPITLGDQLKDPD
jgi:Arc-like DNA binding domain